jgi:short-subunit dehydrogenase involved in D-alanine esterification of teichoic acids
MRILLTGANGFIGLRLLPQLLELGHEVVCAVRDKKRFSQNKELLDKIEVVEIDFLQPAKIPEAIKNIDIAYYLIHSMSGSTTDFDSQEAKAATTFNEIMAGTSVNQVIYLSGIINTEELSKHLKSRKKDEEILKAEMEVSLKTMTGEFIYADSAAVFHTKSAIYGVIINEKAEELITKIQDTNPDPYASFDVTLKVIIKDNTEEDAWPELVNIQNIIKVEQSKDDESLRLVK